MFPDPVDCMGRGTGPASMWSVTYSGTTGDKCAWWRQRQTGDVSMYDRSQENPGKMWHIEPQVSEDVRLIRLC